MSWSPELFIGELMPFPDTVHVVKGKTDEMKRYVPEGSEHSEYYDGYKQLMTRCANLTNLLRDMFPLLNKDLLDERDREMLVSCNDRCLELLGIEKDINDTMPDTDGLTPSEQIEQLARWFKKMGVE